MSDEVFPELAGLEWNAVKKPIYNTKVMESVNGRELRASFQSVPKYEIRLSFAFLREWRGKIELQKLESFFHERRGAFDTFLYKFPEDNCYKNVFVGDGLTTTYQLYKELNGVKMPVSHTEVVDTVQADPRMWNVDTSNPMWDTDTNSLMWLTTTSYSVDKHGVLHLSAPLDVGQSLSVSGTYYYRCRFADDSIEFTHFMHKLWQAKKVDMVGALGNKI